MKRCAGPCGRTLPPGSFYFRDSARGRRHARCRDCQAAYRDRLRDRVFAHYGRSCACCGAGQELTIDHAGGGGREHREELFGPSPGSGAKFHRWLAREGFPEGFQVLCAPCNHSKGDGARCRMHAPAGK